MTKFIDGLSEIAGSFDAIVLDQWGVLHDGTAPYPNAVKTVEELSRAGVTLAVLSNSGKRAAENAERIARIGFDPTAFAAVVTSGEALWQDLKSDLHKVRRVFAIERNKDEALNWISGLRTELVSTPERADAILLLGIPDDSSEDSFTDALETGLSHGLPMFCANPDRMSPREGGRLVISPGTLGHRYAARGGLVRFYGKPFAPVFQAVSRALELEGKRLCMVGDSLEHDIAGAKSVGWKSVFVRGGLHASHFRPDDTPSALTRLISTQRAPAPDFSLRYLG